MTWLFRYRVVIAYVGGSQAVETITKRGAMKWARRWWAYKPREPLTVAVIRQWPRAKMVWGKVR